FATKPQLLTRTTSAAVPSVVTCQPSALNRAANSSESTSLRAQPRVSRATRRTGWDTLRGYRAGTADRVPLSPVAAQTGQHLVQFIRLDQHVTRLGPLTGSDDPAGLHQVHQPAGLGEADPQLALEHRGGAELAGHHQFGGLYQQVEGVADVLVDL